MASPLYAISQYGTPNAYKRASADEAIARDEQRYQEGMDEQRKANAWEEESQQDPLQTALGALMTVGGGAASILSGGTLLPAMAPIIGSGVGMMGSGLAGKKGMRNTRTGQRMSGATDMTGAQIGAQLGKDIDLQEVLKNLFKNG